MVLASPVKNSDQPNVFRCSCLSLSASSKPAPNPMAPRVTAINASSGTVTLLGSEILTLRSFLKSQLRSLARSRRRRLTGLRYFLDHFSRYAAFGTPREVRKRDDSTAGTVRINDRHASNLLLFHDATTLFYLCVRVNCHDGSAHAVSCG